MGKKKKRRPKVLRDEKGEFRWETYFVGGKQKRRKVRRIDGKEFDEYEYIRNNADDIWLLQEGYYEILHDREMRRNDPDYVSPYDTKEPDPF